MGYRLRVSSQLGGWITVKGQQYEVKNHEIEVDDLHTANFMVEHCGCALLGVETLPLAKSILVKRGRGLGDVLMMTPVLRKIKKLYPEAKITYACDLIFLEVLKYLPYIDRIVTIPQLGYHMNDSWITENDGSRTMQEFWINCDGIAENMENHSQIASMHRIDIFGQMAGLKFEEDERTLDYLVSEQEAAWANKEWTALGLTKDDKVLAMAVRTTCFNRNMPLDKFKRISELATQNGWKVMLFDHDGLFGWEAPGIINMTGKTGIRQMGALMAKCSMFFGPDTGAWHMACALNLPNVVYFGAMDWKLRVTMKKTRVIVKNVACYPCNRYDCQWHTKLACVDITPEYCWEQIRDVDKELVGDKILAPERKLALVH